MAAAAGVLAALGIAMIAGSYAAGVSDAEAARTGEVKVLIDGVFALGDQSPSPSPDPSPDPSPEPELTPEDTNQPPEFPTETPEPEPSVEPEPTEPPAPAPTATSAGGDVEGGGIAPPDTGTGRGAQSSLPLMPVALLVAAAGMLVTAGAVSLKRSR